MDLQLKGKVAIVGGASQGIGFGVAQELAREGAKVVITARREPALIEAAGRIRAATGGEVLPVQADVRRSEDCQRVVESTLAAYGGIDILVNNDGAPPIGKIEDFDDVAWQKAVEQKIGRAHV